MGTVTDAYGQKKKHNVMGDTWGHLYPKPGKYPCVAYVSTGHAGASLIDLDYAHVGNPLDMFIYNQFLDCIDDWETPAVYRIDCQLWFFKGCADAYLGEQVGKPIKVKVTKVWKP